VTRRVAPGVVGWILVALISGTSPARAQHVLSVSGETVELSAGSDAGVRPGLEGKLCIPEIVGGKIVENCSARFVVTSVRGDRSIARITRGSSQSVRAGFLAKFDRKLTPPAAKPPPPKPAPPKPSPPKTAGPERERKTPPADSRGEQAFGGIDDHFREAARAFQEGDCPGAVERYEDALRQAPGHAEADIARKRIANCRARAELTPPEQPASLPAAVVVADGLIARAEEQFRAGDLKQARSSAMDALKRDPTSSRARSLLENVRARTSQARFHAPEDLALAQDGSWVIADSGNNTIRLVGPELTRTLAGHAGQFGIADGPATRARFNEPLGVAAAPDGSVVVADRYNSSIRRIATDGSVSTIAGRAGVAGFADGASAVARFREPTRVTVAKDGTIFVSDTGNRAIRAISPSGGVTTLFDGRTERMEPAGLALDPAGDLLVADTANHVIWKVAKGGPAEIFAGVRGSAGARDGTTGSALFNRPAGIALDAAGRVYVADSGNHTIRRIERAEVSTIAGRGGMPGAVDGDASFSRLNRPTALIWIAGEAIGIVEPGNHIVRILDRGFVTTVAGVAGKFGSQDGEN
jgi:sugar lactone lactonase YvrE